MADDHSSIQVLLIEGPSINNGAPGFIEEEIVCSIPDDIEVIQLNNLPEVNFNKPLLPSKPLLPKKQPAPKAKQKRTAAERAKARANKIQPLITLPEPPADSCIDVCGLKVPVKTLLENSDIRKQLAPFIEEIVVSDISDSSDVEEIGKVQRKKAPVIKKRKKQMKPPSSKKRKKSPEPKVKEGTGPFVEVLIPDVPDSTELLGEDIIVNLPLAIEKDAIHDTQKMCVLEEQIQLVTDSSDDEPVVEQRNNGMQKKQILFKKVNLVNRSKSNGLVHTKFKNTAEKIPNSQVVVLDDALKENYKCQDNNLDKNNGQEASVMESDDWYYLNIANTPKINSNSNTKKSTNVNDYSNNEKSTNVNDTSSTAKSTNGNSNTIKSKKFDDNLSMKTPSKVDDNSSMKTSKLDDNLTVITISEENDERIKNGSLVESLPVKSDQGMPNKEPEIETAKPRKRKKRRRIPWSRHAIRGTRVSKYVKAKLQGKIVKGGVKNVINDNQDTTRKSNVMPKKAENADPSSVQKNATNNAPKTSILDKTNPDLDDYILLTCPLCKRKQQKDLTCTKCAHCSCGLVFQCIACGQSFDLRPDLIVHVKCEHYDAHVLTCFSCKKFFFDKHEALTHMKTCGIVPTYYCEFCSFKSKYKHNLTTHIKDKHITMNNGFKCDNCGMEMHNRKGLTKHVFSECPKKVKHKCPKCLYESYDRSNVVVHIFQNHSSIHINHNSVSKKEPLPVVYRGKSFADSKEPTLTIKQEPMLENNVNETTTEVSDVNEVNEEIDKNKLRIKLEQEEKLNEPSINPHPIQRSITTRQKQSKITAKRMFFGKAISKSHIGRRRMIGKCDNCGKKYERLGALRRHQLVCKVSYECAMCIFSTSDKIAFREHLANHILGTNNVHQEVEQSNGPVNNLMAHCSTCSEDSTAVEGLNKCQKCLGYLEYYRCKICEKLFEDYSSLRKHILTSLQGAQIAQSQRDTDQCSRCGANSFSSKCEFRSHLVSKCRPKKTIPMKIPYVRLERCNIPQKLTKVTETQQYHAKSYCPKCSITSVATKGVIECDKCQSKLSFICQVCCNLSITHADLRTHMFSAHSIDLHEYTENSHVPEQKCLSIEKGKSCKKVKPLYEKEHIIQDPTRYREEHVVNSKENTKIFSIYNKTSSLPAIRQVARFDKKIPIQNQKPNIGTVMKIDSPIKRVASNSIETEKQVPVLKTLEKSAFEKEFNNVRYSLSKKTKLGLANQIKRFCIKCDKTKKYYEKIKMGLTREICRKCKMQLLYQCKNCHDADHVCVFSQSRINHIYEKFWKLDTHFLKPSRIFLIPLHLNPKRIM
ncbi:hypothetical protein TSAR_016277 [Trichomalopsis sarcophagae]|uniref:C2H2-type domain-containing protein n=1 Tax=Trichomalopsis sarcophagae TaxID=543379 RepID=A0A232EHW8_9HYME|nr:hypothetical protein TSAR_016277 [Trichomalopsis sarcophagae]